MPQQRPIDLDFDLSGVEAAWTPEATGPAWSGWLPHLDLDRSSPTGGRPAGHSAPLSALGTGDADSAAEPSGPGGAAPSASRRAARLDSSGYRTSATTRGRTAHRRGDSRSAELALDREDAGGPLDGDAEQAVGVPPFGSTSRTRTHRPPPLPLAGILLPWADTDPTGAGRDGSPRPPRNWTAGAGRGAAGVLLREAACASATRSTARAATSARTCRTSSTATTPRSCATSTSRRAINPDHIASAVDLSGRPRAARPRPHRGRQAHPRSATDGRTTVDRRRPTWTSYPGGRVDHARGARRRRLGPERTRDLLTFLAQPPRRRMPRNYARRPTGRRRAPVAEVERGPRAPARTGAAESRPDTRRAASAGRRTTGRASTTTPPGRAVATLLATAPASRSSEADGWPSPSNSRRRT